MGGAGEGGAGTAVVREGEEAGTGQERTSRVPEGEYTILVKWGTVGEPIRERGRDPDPAPPGTLLFKMLSKIFEFYYIFYILREKNAQSMPKWRRCGVRGKRRVPLEASKLARTRMNGYGNRREGQLSGIPL